MAFIYPFLTREKFVIDCERHLGVVRKICHVTHFSEACIERTTKHRLLLTDRAAIDFGDKSETKSAAWVGRQCAVSQCDNGSNRNGRFITFYDMATSMEIGRPCYYAVLPRGPP